MKKQILASVSLLATIVLTGSLSLPAQAATPTLHFSRALPNSSGSDRGSNTSLNNEWIRVHNSGSHTRTLTGYTIRDRVNHVYTFGTFRLGPHKSVTVHTGRGTDTSSNVYWGQHWYVWNNTGDGARLRTSAGTTVDRCSWGSVANGAIVRC